MDKPCSAKYEKLLLFYVLKLWSAHRLQKAVEKGWLTQDEYARITGLAPAA